MNSRALIQVRWPGVAARDTGQIVVHGIGVFPEWGRERTGAVDCGDGPVTIECRRTFLFMRVAEAVDALEESRLPEHHFGQDRSHRAPIPLCR